MKREKLEKRKKVVLSLLLHPQYKPMRAKEIAMIFELPRQEKGALSGLRRPCRRGEDRCRPQRPL